MTRALPVVLLAALLAGCTSSGPDVPDASAFAAGTCRTAAPDVRAVGQALPELTDERVDGSVKQALREAQDRLDAMAGGAEPDVAPALQDLVVSIGAVRIRADGNTYAPSLGDALERSYERVLEVCTAR